MPRHTNPEVPDHLRNRVLDVVADEFGVDRDELLSRRGPDPWGTLARHIVHYVVSVEGGFGAESTGRAFGRDHSQITYAAQRIEDRRDTPVFEHAIERVTSRLRSEGLLQ